jgi:hypothetical protein
MKNFVKENWYKLMIGFSMVTFSISAFIYSVSPAMANNNEHKTQFNSNMPVSNQGVTVGEFTYFVDEGYVYRCRNLGKQEGWNNYLSWRGNHKNTDSTSLIWQKSKLP